MKKIWLIGLIIAAMAVPFVSSAQVEVGSGAMQISGKIKWLYTYQAEDEDALPDGGVSFGTNYWGMNGVTVENLATTNVEIDISGAVGENVQYVIELQSANSNAGWASNPNDMGAVGIRSAYIVIADVIPMTNVVVGTGMGPISTYQQRATNDLDLIMLPLMNIATFGNPAPFAYTPIGLGWQATGVYLQILPMDVVELGIGYANGNAGGAPNADIDLEKTVAGKLAIMPSEGARFEIAYLDEGWQEDVNNWPSGGTERQHATGYVISGSYITDQLEANFDYMTMTAEDYTVNKKGKIDDLNWIGYQVTVGVWATEALELLVRYELIDPNTENAKKNPVVQSAYDDMTAITVGVNSRLNDNAEVSLNYVMLQEPGSKIDVKKGKVPGYVGVPPGAANIKYQQVDNDLILLQVQVWQ